MARKPTIKAVDGPVDEFIGSSYDVVKGVYDELPLLNNIHQDAQQLATEVNAAADEANNILSQINTIQTDVDLTEANITSISQEVDQDKILAQAAADNADISETNAANSEMVADQHRQNSADSAAAANLNDQSAGASAFAAQTSETNAKSSENAAAVSETNVNVSKIAAENAANNSSTSATAASVSETNAQASENAAATSELNAATSETNASDLAQAAHISKNAAEISESNAAISETNAAASEQAASTSEINAANSEVAASISETNAATSEGNAQTAENKAEEWAEKNEDLEVELGRYSSLHHSIKAKDAKLAAKTAEGNAKDSETNALSSATQAGNSATAALASENAASTLESNASTSASQAASSASAAGTSETNAALSATAASDSETAAALSESNALAFKNDAASSASAAATSETNTATSESNALSSANSASNSAAAAGNYADNAEVSATNASSSESLAEKWATEVENTEVVAGKYSATHWAMKAAESAQAAAQSAQSASTAMYFAGEWDASTGTAPPLPAEGSPFYKVSTSGTINAIDYNPGDQIVFDNISNIWFKIDGSDKVASVNGKIGSVTLDLPDLSSTGTAAYREVAGGTGNLIVYGSGNLQVRNNSELDVRYLNTTNDLSDLSNASIARDNLLLGTMATEASADYVLKTTSVSVGDGLSGGGTLSTNISVSVDSTVARYGTTSGTVRTNTQNDARFAPIAESGSNIAGTGLSWGTGNLNIDNPFNPTGDYGSLRARATTKADVGLSAVVNSDTTDATNITSGVLADARIPFGITRDSQLAAIAESGQWSDILNKPVTATRWPSWNEVTSKPVQLLSTPDSYGNLDNARTSINSYYYATNSPAGTSTNIANVISLARNEGGNYIAQFGMDVRYGRGDFYSRAKDDVGFSTWAKHYTTENKPTWSDVTGKPSTYPSSSHEHGYRDVTFADQNLRKSDVVRFHEVIAGEGSGSVALTVNDGYGNANVTFNHKNGAPDVNGSSARIVTGVDNNLGYMRFEMDDNVTSGTEVSLTKIMHLTTSKIDLEKETYHHNDVYLESNSWLWFTDVGKDSIRLNLNNNNELDIYNQTQSGYAIVNAQFKGDGSRLTDIGHGATNFANQNLNISDRPKFDGVEFNPVANGDLRSSWGTGITIDADYPGSGWTTASFSPRSIRGFQLAAGTSYSESPTFQYRTVHSNFNNGLSDWIKVYTSVDKPIVGGEGDYSLQLILNDYIEDSQGRPRLYFGDASNIHAGIFRAGSSGQEWSFRDSGNATKFLLEDNGNARVYGNLAVDGNTNTTGTYYGDGSGLTDLNASNISSGTLSDNRLPSNIARTNDDYLTRTKLGSYIYLRDYDDGNSSTGLETYIRDGAWYINRDTTTPADPQIFLDGNQVYHEGYKPTASELGLSDAATTTVSTIRSGTTKADIGLGSVDNYSRAHYDGRYAAVSHSHNYLSNSGGTIDGGTNTDLVIKSNDSGRSRISLYGDSQGTGQVYVGQNSIYGGGIEYNGNNSPTTTGAGSDYITLYRVSDGTYSWTAKNPHNSNNWEFRGQVTATQFNGNGSGLTSLNASNISSGTLDVNRISSNIARTNGDYLTSTKLGKYTYFRDYANGNAVSGLKSYVKNNVWNIHPENSSQGSTEINLNGNQVYHEGHKPTKGDVGLGSVINENFKDYGLGVDSTVKDAVLNGQQPFGFYKFDDRNSGTNEVYGQQVGTIRFGYTGGRQTEITASINGPRLWWRNQEDLDIWSTDYEIYHEGHKPTYSELGVITKNDVNFANQDLNIGSNVEFDGVYSSGYIHTSNVLISEGNNSSGAGTVLRQTHSNNASGINSLAYAGSTIKNIRLDYIANFGTQALAEIAFTNYNDSGSGWYNYDHRKKVGFKFIGTDNGELGKKTLLEVTDKGIVNTLRGITGSYGEGNPGDGSWGLPIWSMGDEFSGVGSGAGFQFGTNATYGLFWLRNGATDSDPFVGEGLYIRRGTSNSGRVAEIGQYGSIFFHDIKADSYQNRSDSRLKNNIENYTFQVGDVEAKKWVWKEDENVSERKQNTADIGVIAQEVETIFPECVQQDQTGMRSIDYGKLGTLNSIKANKKINKLEQEVKELKELVNALINK